MNLKSIFSKKNEKVLFFEADREGARALKAEVNKEDKIVKLERVFSLDKSEDSKALQINDILSFLSQVISESPKSSSLVLVLGKPFVKVKSFNFIASRENPLSIMDETEIENFLSLAVEKNTEDELPRISSFLANGKTILAESKISHIKMDGRQIMNPLGFSGDRLKFSLKNVYSRKDVFDSLEDLLKSKRCRLKSLIDRTSNMDKTFSYIKEEGVLIDITDKRVKVNLLGQASYRASGFKWGWDTIRKEIIENLSVSRDQAEKIRNMYTEGNMSSKALSYFDLLFKEEMKILAEGLVMTLKSFQERNIAPNIYFSGTDPMLSVIIKNLGKASWGRGLFIKKPEILIYPKREIFDKIDLQVEEGDEVSIEDLSLAIVLLVAGQFIKEPNYSSLNKLLKRFIRWFQ